MLTVFLGLAKPIKDDPTLGLIIVPMSKAWKLYTHRCYKYDSCFILKYETQPLPSTWVAHSTLHNPTITRLASMCSMWNRALDSTWVMMLIPTKLHPPEMLSYTRTISIFRGRRGGLLPLRAAIWTSKLLIERTKVLIPSGLQVEHRCHFNSK